MHNFFGFCFVLLFSLSCVDNWKIVPSVFNRPFDHESGDLRPWITRTHFLGRANEHDTK